MKLKLFVFSLLAIFALTACSEENQISSEQDVDIKGLVSDYSNKNLNAESASITSHQLNVTDNDGKELVYDLPENEFFVSIAPYINESHP